MNCADISVGNTIGYSTSNDTLITIDFDEIIEDRDCEFVDNSTHFSSIFGTIKTNYTFNELGFTDISQFPLSSHSDSASLETIISKQLVYLDDDDDIPNLYVISDDDDDALFEDVSPNSTSVLCPNPDANNIDGIIDYQTDYFSLCGFRCPYRDSNGNSMCRCEDGQCCSSQGLCGPILYRYLSDYDSSTGKTTYRAQYRNYSYLHLYDDDDSSVTITQIENGFYSDSSVAFADYCDGNQGDWRLIDCDEIDSDSDDDTYDGGDISFDLENINVFTIVVLLFGSIVVIIILLIFVYWARKDHKKHKDNNSMRNVNTVSEEPSEHRKDNNSDLVIKPYTNQDVLEMDGKKSGAHGQQKDGYLPDGLAAALPETGDTLYGGDGDESYSSDNGGNNNNNNNTYKATTGGEMPDAPMTEAPSPPQPIVGGGGGENDINHGAEAADDGLISKSKKNNSGIGGKFKTMFKNTNGNNNNDNDDDEDSFSSETFGDGDGGDVARPTGSGNRIKKTPRVPSVDAPPPPGNFGNDNDNNKNNDNDSDMNEGQQETETGGNDDYDVNPFDIAQIDAGAAFDDA